MLFVYLVLAALSLFGIHFHLKSFNDEYLSHEKTLSIKGVFTVLVFCRHFKQYVELGNGFFDKAFTLIDYYLWQLIVVVFLFCSGYGIMAQMIRNGKGYVKAFLKHRFLPVYCSFAICIVFFLLVDCLIGRISNYSWWKIVLAFTGWTSVGNSNWFMFDTFALYLLTFISFIIPFKNEKYSLLLFTFFSFCLVAVLYLTKSATWWNTLLCFPLGMWYGVYKKRIDKIMKNNKCYLYSLLIILLLFLFVWKNHYRDTSLIYIIVALFFSMVVTLITMKIDISNKVLEFFGRHLFSIYILQRIPFLILDNKIENYYLFFVCSFSITILVSVFYDYFFGKIRLLFQRVRHN